MKEELVQLFGDYPGYAILISLFVSILVAILGLLPSVFVTAANILFFGLWEGIALSFAGEAIGALIAFLLYRKGFKKGLGTSLHRHPRLAQLIEAEETKARGLVFSLRLLPFVPSGLVTFAAAIGNISAAGFFIASSLGKIPALLLEGFSVYEVTRFGTPGKIILALTGIILVYIILRPYFRKN